LLEIFPTKCNFTHFIYFWKTALHPSSGAHTTVFTVTGTCQTVTATCRYCGTALSVVWELYCYGAVADVSQFMCSWWWVELPPETCRAFFQK